MVLGIGARWECYRVMRGRRSSCGGCERVKAEPGLYEQVVVGLTVNTSFN